MIIEFKLPELGENIVSADVSKILVAVGDKVSVNQAIVEIETDKATIEVPSEFDGIIKEVKIKNGSKAKVGEVILLIETNTEKVIEKPVDVKPEPKHEVKQEEKQEILIPQKSITQSVEKTETSFEKIELPKKIAPASPSVRRFAREIGIDIHKVSGSGSSGRITEDDVKKFAKSINEKLTKGEFGVSGTGIFSEPLPDFSKWGEVSIEPMNNVRRKTAEHLSYAWASIPHVTQFDKADITELENFRKLYSKKIESKGAKLTVTAILLKVIASALKNFPEFNTSIDLQKQEIIHKNYYNIGVAVDTERGLIVPVIKNVDKKNITELALELNSISEKARNKKTTLEEMHGGNFTISNLGGIGGTAFTPIVNSPEVAILGVSKSEFQPVYIDGKFEPRLIMPLSLSYDHRIIDGANGARFLRWVCSALENPFLMALEG